MSANLGRQITAQDLQVIGSTVVDRLTRMDDSLPRPAKTGHQLPPSTRHVPAAGSATRVRPARDRTAARPTRFWVDGKVRPAANEQDQHPCATTVRGLLDLPAGFLNTHQPGFLGQRAAPAAVAAARTTGAHRAVLAVEERSAAPAPEPVPQPLLHPLDPLCGRRFHRSPFGADHLYHHRRRLLSACSPSHSSQPVAQQSPASQTPVVSSRTPVAAEPASPAPGPRFTAPPRSITSTRPAPSTSSPSTSSRSVSTTIHCPRG